MKDKPLIVFALVTLMLVIAAWITSMQRTPETVLDRAPLYPDLIGQVNQVQRIEITSTKETTLLRRSGRDWVLENRGGYPALFEKVKQMVVGVADLKVRERKTRDPALFAKLGVEDPDSDDAQSLRVRLLDEDGDSFADLLVGKRADNAAARDISSLYVRPTEGPQALLVDGELDVSAVPTDWLDTSLVNIDEQRLKKMIIQHPDGATVTIFKSDPDAQEYQLQDIPPDREVKSASLLNSQMTVLKDLHFDDVYPADQWAPNGGEIVRTRIEGFDGLVVSVETADGKPGMLSRFAFEYESALDEGQPAVGTEAAEQNGDTEQEPKQSVAEEMAALHEQASRWVYKLPEFQLKKLTRSKGDLLKDLSSEAAAPGSGNDLDQQLQDAVQSSP